MKSINLNSNQLVSILNNTIPSITEIYLFGSHSKNCPRKNSDIDILIRVGDTQISENLLSSDIGLPNYIDAFLELGDKAIGLLTKYEIRERDSDALINRLNPIKIWDYKSDFISLHKNFFILNTQEIKLTGGTAD